MSDWGRIAAGCRIAKHPEALFFASWTGLIAGGTRQDDAILAPTIHTPAHWASDSLARSLLKSDCDSLLMIDDDMSFEPDALERLRTNPANQGYDVVMALCTSKELPPRPIVVSLVDGVFKTNHDFQDGDVVPVDMVGLAFTLIRRRVFEAMLGESAPEQGFFFSYGPGRESDDVPFCRRVRELGFRMAVDTAVKIDHIGAFAYGWHQYQALRRVKK